MGKVTSFAPTVMVDGHTVTPEGWMWVLGFAIGGCQWAIDACSKPEFKEAMGDYYKREITQEIEEEKERIRVLEAKIKSIEEAVERARQEGSHA